MTLMLDRDPALAPSTGDTDRGQAAFSRTGLALYDLLVLRGVCPWVWRCPNERIFAAYRRHLSNNHLEVGVGTGLAVAALAGRRTHPVPYSYRTDPRVPPFPDDRPIFIFDAHCVLCSRWVELVLRYDRAGLYRLLSAQSALGRALYVHYGLDPENYETNILLIEGVALIKAEPSWTLATSQYPLLPG